MPRLKRVDTSDYENPWTLGSIFEPDEHGVEVADYVADGYARSLAMARRLLDQAEDLATAAQALEQSAHDDVVAWVRRHVGVREVTAGPTGKVVVFVHADGRREVESDQAGTFSSTADAYTYTVDLL
jgi:hypothetical protein